MSIKAIFAARAALSLALRARKRRPRTIIERLEHNLADTMADHLCVPDSMRADFLQWYLDMSASGTPPTLAETREVWASYSEVPR